MHDSLFQVRLHYCSMNVSIICNRLFCLPQMDQQQVDDVLGLLRASLLLAFTVSFYACSDIGMAATAPAFMDFCPLFQMR